MAAFLANVGVNAGHAARSHLRSDGCFDILPIPERIPWRQPMLRFADLDFQVPKSWRNRAAHLDPDFASTEPTYGDNCRHAGRAYSLRQAQRGDVIAFLARLWGGEHPALHLVAALQVTDVLSDVTEEPGAGWWDANAHVRRARALKRWDSFWVFRGGPSSGRLRRPLKFVLGEAAAIFGQDWTSSDGRTEQQTIASHTRAVRRLTGPGEQRLRELLDA